MMRLPATLLVVSSLLCVPAAARLRESPPSWGEPVLALDQVPLRVLAPPDMAEVRRQDALEWKNAPFRFAVRHDVDFGMADSGLWELLPDGSRLWRLRIGSSQALSLNLHLDRFALPPGGRLFIYNPSRGSAEGPYTARHRTADGDLWTPVIRGDVVVVEVHLPAGSLEMGEVHFGGVNHGYRYFFADLPEGDSHGSCNNDVICPEGNPWRAQIRSVAVYSLGGGRICTGQMVNNTAQDFTPYFLTAYHCGINSGNAGSLVVYWNYDAPVCGQMTGGSLADNQTGSTLRARYGSSDFCLVELSQQPDPAFAVHYSGWNRSGSNPSGAVAIHHPQTHVKSISFENQALTPNSYGSSTGNDGTHWRIGDWDDGTTEGGSSGSGIWDPADGLLVGQLHGGSASCTSQTSDWYGRFDRSWSGGGAASSRLSDWLDPGNTGNTTQTGADPGGGTAPVANFSGSPLNGTAPLSVAFTDLSSGAPTSWAWTFGDGGTSAAQNPAHVYNAAGSYTVALTATNASGSDTETKVGYVTVTAGAVLPDFLVGQGLGQPNPNQVRLHTGAGTATAVDFQAYGAGQWGVNVSAGDVDGPSHDEIVTGPGPGAVFGPHVRGFLRDGTPMGKVSFYAYGTLKYGVNVAGASVDCDGFDEIVSGAGPGEVFGPHVRGWNVDGGTAASIAKISFFAYGTLQWGVNVAGGDVDGDGYAEILTAPGPGPSFAGQIKAFDFDCSAIAAVPGVNFAVTTAYGANVAGGDVDADAFAEIATAPGPGNGACCPSRFRGYNFDGTAITAMAGFDVQPFTTTYGGRVGLGDVGGSSAAELLAGAGRDPAADATARSFAYAGSTLTPGATFNPFVGRTYGVNVQAGAYGY